MVHRYWKQLPFDGLEMATQYCCTQNREPASNPFCGFSLNVGWSILSLLFSQLAECHEWFSCTGRCLLSRWPLNTANCSQKRLVYPVNWTSNSLQHATELTQLVHDFLFPVTVPVSSINIEIKSFGSRRTFNETNSNSQIKLENFIMIN